MSVSFPYRFLFVFVLFLAFCVSFCAVAQDAPIVMGTGAVDYPDSMGMEDAQNEKGAMVPAGAVVTPGDEGFFDADDLVPQGEMARAGPIRVNPSTQPASKYIVVKQNYKADTKTARLVSAERAAALGRYDSALLMFDDLYEKNKKDSRVLMGRAVALQKLGRFDEAMQMYEALSEVDPENIDFKVNMLGLLATRYPSVALRRLLDLHEKERSHVGLTAQIAIAYAQAGDVTSALRYLGVASSMEPNNANHVFNMAVISDRAGRSKEAISYYEQALEVDTVYGAGRTIPRDTVYERLAQIR